MLHSIVRIGATPVLIGIVAALCVLAAPSLADDERQGVLGHYVLDDPHLKQWALPSRLREISGLALTPDGRLLVVDDERAIVYEADYRDGGLVKAFAFDNPVVRGDFEGIAVTEEGVWLMTSDAKLYVAREGADGERVSYKRFKTNLDDECEFEGLAADRARHRLLLLCKNVGKKADQIDELAIFVWDIGAEDVKKKATIELPVKDIGRKLGTRHLHPSGIAVSRDGESLLIVAARENALIEIDADGNLLDAILLTPTDKHPQAEGIEIDTEGSLIISDEGRDGRARLSIYEPGS